MNVLKKDGAILYFKQFNPSEYHIFMNNMKLKFVPSIKDLGFYGNNIILDMYY